MGNVEAQFAALKATVEAGFASSNRRLDDLRFEQGTRMDRMERVQAERHSENSGHLERIEEKQDLTNGKVIRHEEQIRTLFARLKNLATAPATAVTLSNLKWYLTCAGAGAALTLWLLKLIGKL